MRKKPMMGLAGLILAGAALAGCETSKPLQRTGGATTGATASAQSRGWDNQRGTGAATGGAGTGATGGYATDTAPGRQSWDRGDAGLTQTSAQTKEPSNWGDAPRNTAGGANTNFGAPRADIAPPAMPVKSDSGFGTSASGAPANPAPDFAPGRSVDPVPAPTSVPPAAGADSRANPSPTTTRGPTYSDPPESARLLDPKGLPDIQAPPVTPPKTTDKLMAPPTSDPRTFSGPVASPPVDPPPPPPAGLELQPAKTTGGMTYDRAHGGVGP